MRLINSSLRRLSSALLASLTLPLVLGLQAQPAAAAEPRTKAWGANPAGQLGDGTLTDRTSPVTVPGLTGVEVTSLVSRRGHSMALLSNGTVESWGANGFGQLGYDDDGFTPGTIPNLSGVKGVAVGFKHSLVLRADGTVVAWGINDAGQMGNGGVPGAPVINLTGVKAIAAGDTFSMALLSDGTVRAWGDNSFGQLGRGFTGGTSGTPAPVINLSGVRAIAAGGEHAMAVLADGTVQAWGQNTSGQLGRGAVGGDSGTPAPVINLSSVKAIAGGFAHSLALRQDGTVEAWGSNDSGQLGRGLIGSAFGTPEPVINLSGVRAIAAGGAHSLALQRHSVLKAWGSNSNGQLGNGTTDPSDTPITVQTGLDGATLIAAGGAHSLMR